MNWERVFQKKLPYINPTYETDSIMIWRSKVPGGWLILTVLCDSASTSFYPDPEYKWVTEAVPTMER